MQGQELGIGNQESEMTRRQKRGDQPVSFQITAMIDMTFLLLIFFMVTSKLSKEQVKVDIALPKASAAKIPDDTGNRDIINVDAAGNFYIANEIATEEQLRAHLKKRLAVHPPLKIYYRADENTPYEVTDKFMSMAAESGAAGGGGRRPCSRPHRSRVHPPRGARAAGRGAPHPP